MLFLPPKIAKKYNKAQKIGTKISSRYLQDISGLNTYFSHRKAPKKHNEVQTMETKISSRYFGVECDFFPSRSFIKHNEA